MASALGGGKEKEKEEEEVPGGRGSKIKSRRGIKER